MTLHAENAKHSTKPKVKLYAEKLTKEATPCQVFFCDYRELECSRSRIKLS